MKLESTSKSSSEHPTSRYLPNFSVTSVLNIDFAELKRIGVTHVLFDLDLTLRKRRAPYIEAEIITYLVDQQKVGTFKTLSLATNNIHDVSAFSKPLGARVFQPFYAKGRLVHKPHRLFFERIISELGVEPAQIAMIGDKLKYDVAPANDAGMVTILIDPIDKDNFFDKVRFLRMREKRLLKKARASLALVQKINS